jgi:hypothetical protein
MWPVRKDWQIYHFHVPTVLKSGSINHLQQWRTVQSCTGFALSLALFIRKQFLIINQLVATFGRPMQFRYTRTIEFHLDVWTDRVHFNSISKPSLEIEREQWQQTFQNVIHFFNAKYGDEYIKAIALLFHAFPLGVCEWLIVWDATKVKSYLRKVNTGCYVERVVTQSQVLTCFGLLWGDNGLPGVIMDYQGVIMEYPSCCPSPSDSFLCYSYRK